MVYTPPTYNNPVANNPVSQGPFGPPAPGSILPRDEDGPEHVNAYAKRIHWLKKLWYEEHPVCGRFLGCDRSCPYYRPIPAMGQLFPHCKHPDITEERYLP